MDSRRKGGRNEWAMLLLYVAVVAGMDGDSGTETSLQPRLLGAANLLGGHRECAALALTLHVHRTVRVEQRTDMQLERLQD